MRLVYLSSVRLPTKNAHGFQIMNMCSAFAEAGVGVELVVPRRFNLLKEDAFAFYKIPRSFQVTVLPVVDLYRFRSIPESISAAILTFSFLISAWLYLWSKKYDVLYTREERAGFFFKNYVYEIHAPEQLGKAGFKSKKLIVLNEHIKKVLLERGHHAAEIFVAPDAVNLSLFGHISREEARRVLQISETARVALYFGNFKKWKGVDTFAEAVKFLPDVHCMMIGGTKESDVARIKRIVGSAPNARVEGFKPQEEMPTYLAAADVLVLPNSQYDENSRLFTSPLKLFEYMAAERPIVASDLPSLREILSENTAQFFAPDNAESLAESIEAVLSDEARSQELSSDARREVGRFTWRARAEKIVAFIQK